MRVPRRERRRRTLWRALLGLVVALGVAMGVPGQAAAQVEVVTTLPPLADLVRQVGGERVTVTALVPPGASPHGYEPRPSDLRALARARLVVWVGAGLDTWLEPLLATARDAARLELAQTTPLLPSEEGPSHPGRGPGAGGEHDHHHGPWDPHIWLDPLRVRDDLAPAIAQALAALDPQGSGTYQANLARFQEALTRLDQEVRALLAPYQGARFVAVHSAWRYFAARYGLEQAGSLHEYPGREPGPAWMAALITQAREAGVRLVVTEAQFDPRLAQQVAREVGVPVVALDPLGGPGVEGMEGYMAMIKTTACRLSEALAGAAGR